MQHNIRVNPSSLSQVHPHHRAGRRAQAAAFGRGDAVPPQGSPIMIINSKNGTATATTTTTTNNNDINRHTTTHNNNNNNDIIIMIRITFCSFHLKAPAGGQGVGGGGGGLLCDKTML